MKDEPATFRTTTEETAFRVISLNCAQLRLRRGWMLKYRIAEEAKNKARGEKTRRVQAAFTAARKGRGLFGMKEQRDV